MAGTPRGKLAPPASPERLIRSNSSGTLDSSARGGRRRSWTHMALKNQVMSLVGSHSAGKSPPSSDIDRRGGASPQPRNLRCMSTPGSSSRLLNGQASAASKPPEPHQGYVFVNNLSSSTRPGAKRKGWVERHCYACGNFIRYKRKFSRGGALGDKARGIASRSSKDTVEHDTEDHELDLCGATVTKLEDTEGKGWFCLKLESCTGGQQWLMAAGTEAERQGWVDALTAGIEFAAEHGKGTDKAMPIGQRCCTAPIPLLPELVPRSMPTPHFYLSRNYKRRFVFLYFLEVKRPLALPSLAY
ncbi:unnamed protein product, partial [Chrysoparadoxa australica]